MSSSAAEDVLQQLGVSVDYLVEYERQRVDGKRVSAKKLHMCAI